jgi:Ice-binding-like/Bacterial Ig-like domain
MKQKRLIITIVLSIVVLIIGCSKDDFNEIIGVCPVVESTNPSDGVTNVPLNQVITVTFNEEMNPSTINQNSFTIVGTSLVGGSINYSGTTATFTPTVALTPNTTYVGTVTTALHDLNGNALQQDYVWSFTTGAILQPRVLTTSPIPNETGVVLNKVISATFSMPMNPVTISQTTFLVKQGTTPILGTVSYIGNSAYFTPNVNLNSNLVYTATITTGAENTANTGISVNYVWSFTTGVLIAPKVITTDPANNATGVLLNKTITATFDMALNPLTITEVSFTLKQGNTTVLGIVSYLGNTATFNPTIDLLAGATYTATLSTVAKNLAGVPLADNYVWTFKTLNNSASPNLRTMEMFGAFGGTAGVTNQGLNTVINNGGLSTTAVSTKVTGFHDATAIYTETPLNVGNVIGGIFTAPPLPGTATSFTIATQALADANVAYISISPAMLPGGSNQGAGELGGLTLVPGVYKSASGSYNISNGNLTLDAQGNPNAIWVFQTTSGLTVGISGPTGAKSIILTNGALAKNVYWYVGSAATINAAGGGVMVGNILAYAGVTFSTPGNVTQTVLNGRAISLIASVTMVNTTINVPN